jgi:leader peptidase (prepilin peptidase) / N-methyltransferase
MNSGLLIAFALLGLITGSFIATVALRWPQGRSSALGRSRCDQCGKVVSARDLVPLLSFLWLGGKARCCGAAIDRLHPVVEALSAGVGLAAIAVLDWDQAIAASLFGWMLILLAVLDWRHFWLPNGLVFLLLVVGLIVSGVGAGADVSSATIGAVAGFVSLQGVALIYKRLRGFDGLGGGDPKLFGAIGAWVGWQMLPLVMLVAGVLGLGYAALLRARGVDVTARDRLPLGTFLAVAAWPVWVWIAI